MSEPLLFRIGSVSAVVGGALAIVVNVLHPRTAGIDQPENWVAMVAASGIWLGDHVAIMFPNLMLTGGLIAIAHSITKERGAAWAQLGYAGAVISAALLAVWIAIDGIATKAVADAWASAPAAEKAAAFRLGHAMMRINVALFSVWLLVWGVTIVLYGLAVATTTLYPRWLGMAGVLVGLGATLVGLTQALTGPSHLVTTILIGISAFFLTSWVMVIGVLLWRQGARSV